MKKKPLDYYQKYPLVYIEWVDAESDNRWNDKEGVDKWMEMDFVVNDIGWLVCENDKYLLICNQVASDGDLGNRTKIPKQWIRKLSRITIVKRGKR